MKIRNGFVTNSSSSSFVVSFKDNKDMGRGVMDIFAECGGDAGIFLTDISENMLGFDEARELVKKYYWWAIHGDVVRDVGKKDGNGHVINIDEVEAEKHKRIDVLMKGFDSKYKNNKIFARVTYSNHDSAGEALIDSINGKNFVVFSDE